MSSAKVDKAKGRLEEAAGALTGDEKLKAEGQLDQAAADVKEADEKAVDKVSDALTGKK